MLPTLLMLLTAQAATEFDPTKCKNAHPNGRDWDSYNFIYIYEPFKLQPGQPIYCYSADDVDKQWGTKENNPNQRKERYSGNWIRRKDLQQVKVDKQIGQLPKFNPKNCHQKADLMGGEWTEFKNKTIFIYKHGNLTYCYSREFFEGHWKGKSNTLPENRKLTHPDEFKKVVVSFDAPVYESLPETREWRKFLQSYFVGSDLEAEIENFHDKDLKNFKKWFNHYKKVYPGYSDVYIIQQAKYSQHKVYEEDNGFLLDILKDSYDYNVNDLVNALRKYERFNRSSFQKWLNFYNRHYPSLLWTRTNKRKALESCAIDFEKFERKFNDLEFRIDQAKNAVVA